MNILAARKYATPRNGPLTLEQTETRRLAYSIKSTASPSIDFDTAAREMAVLITGPCWLVPIRYLLMLNLADPILNQTGLELNAFPRPSEQGVDQGLEHALDLALGQRQAAMWTWEFLSGFAGSFVQCFIQEGNLASALRAGEDLTPNGKIYSLRGAVFVLSLVHPTQLILDLL